MADITYEPTLADASSATPILRIGRSAQSPTKVRVLVGLVVIMATAFVLYGLTRSPVTWVDEVFYAAPARQLARTGNLSDPIFFNLLGLNNHFSLQPPIYEYVMAIAFRLFGFSQTIVRLGSAIPYIISIPTTYFIARALALSISKGSQQDYRRASWAGLIGAFLVAFNEQSLEMARSGRSDEFSLLLLLIGFRLILLAKTRNSRIAMITGVFIVSCAPLSHPMMAFPAMGIVISLVIKSWNQPHSQYRRTVWIGLLGVLPAICGAILWIVSDYNAFRVQFMQHVVGAAGGAGIIEHIQNFVDPLHLEFIIVFVVTIGTIIVLSHKQWEATGAIVGMFVGVAISAESYFKFLLVLLIVVGAPGLILLMDVVKARKRSIMVAAGIVLAAMNGLGFAILRAAEIADRYQQRSPQLVTDNIRRYVPNDTRVLGTSVVYYATTERGISFRYFAPLYGLRFRQWDGYSRSQFETDVLAFHPNVLILPPNITPESYYCYLPARYRQVNHFLSDVSSGLNPDSLQTIDYIVWRVTYGAPVSCRIG